jgi:hypothetical protein
MSTEEEYKITVSLSRKGLNILDTLKETSGFGSRGRTIEEAIISVYELTEMGKPLFLQVGTEMQKQGAISPLTQASIAGWFVIVMAKLTRFMSTK